MPLTWVAIALFVASLLLSAWTLGHLLLLRSETRLLTAHLDHECSPAPARSPEPWLHTSSPFGGSVTLYDPPSGVPWWQHDPKRNGTL